MKSEEMERHMGVEKRFPEDLPMWGDKKNSVQDVRRFLDALHAPDEGLKIIHVAGTNGKGSVCAYLTQALMDAGKRVGTFISPHLVNIRERIRIDNVPIDEDDFLGAASAVRREGEKWAQKGGNFPAYFEYLYYMAMLLFKEQKVDYVLLETGLGGRLDATNSCRPILTIITSISLDHMQYLGNTVEKIAAEKAGIIKEGIPVVYDFNDFRTEAVIRKTAEMRHAEAVRGTVIDEIPEAYDFLPAPYMRRNAKLAECAFHILSDMESFVGNIPFQESVRRTRFEGRMQEIFPDVFLDGGHNEDGVRAMAEGGNIICRERQKKAILLTAAVKDKDLEQVTQRFVKQLTPKKVYLAKLDSYRTADVSEMEALYRKTGVSEVQRFDDVREAFQKAFDEKKEDEILFVSGSLYLVGEVLEVCEELKRKHDKFR